LPGGIEYRLPSGEDLDSWPGLAIAEPFDEKEKGIDVEDEVKRGSWELAVLERAEAIWRDHCWRVKE